MCHSIVLPYSVHWPFCPSHSSPGRTQSHLHPPLQEKLNNLAELITKIGGIAGLTLFIALMIHFFVQLGAGDPVRYVLILFVALPPALTCFHGTASANGVAFTRMSIISVTLVIVIVPEGLLLTVMLTLAFATKQTTVKTFSFVLFSVFVTRRQ